MRLALLILLAAAVSLAAGDDPYCPAYPKSQRIADQARLELEKQTSSFSRQQRRSRAPASQASLRLQVDGNVIDAYIFGKMAADGVEAAPLASDQEILRRLYLDLTGRIPTIDDAVAFLQDGTPEKRIQLIDRLMNSEAFVDYWTFFYANHFEVTSRYYNFVGIPGRNLFYNAVRDFVATGRSYRYVVTCWRPTRTDIWTLPPE